MKKALYNFLPIITLAAIFLIWFISASQLNNAIIIPRPSDVFKSFLSFVKTKKFAYSVINTVLRTLYSFLLAFVPSLILAFFSARFSVFRKLCYPLIVMLRAVPTMSVIILCLIWLKSTESPLAVAFLVTFPMLYSAFYESFKAVDYKLLEMSKVYKVRKSDIIFRLYIPTVARNMFGHIINLISFNVKLIVAGEALAYTNLSLGVNLQISKTNLDMAAVFAYTIVAIVLSYVMELIIRLIGFIIKKVRK